jgi:DNA-binding CsgD family transcriptional regulator
MVTAPAYDRHRRRRLAEGTWQPPVCAREVQAHIAVLRAAGMSSQRIADAAGVAERTIRNVRSQRQVNAATATAILAVLPVPKPIPAGQVPSLGVSRRVQALAAIGWSLTEQGRRLGMPLQYVWELSVGRHRTVSAGTAERVIALFDQLSGTPGGSARARTAAARNGWLPPLGWEDIDGDCAVEEPEPDHGDVDELAVERALSGERIRLTDAELLAAAQIGVARGLQPWHVAERLHMNVFGVRRLLAGELPPRRAKRAARAGGVAS